MALITICERERRCTKCHTIPCWHSVWLALVNTPQHHIRPSFTGDSPLTEMNEYRLPYVFVLLSKVAGSAYWSTDNTNDNSLDINMTQMAPENMTTPGITVIDEQETWQLRMREVSNVYRVAS